MYLKSSLMRCAALAALLTVAAIPVAAQEPTPAPAPVQVEEDTNDPIEGINRGIFWYNNQVDRFFLKPVAKVYRTVVPEFGRNRVRNFLDNLDSPVIFANDLLQGEFDRGGQTMARFMINTTVGVGGLFDVAEDLGVPQHSEDFGQTLAVWGVGEGPYLMLPFLGPSNPRDLTGRIVDLAFDPLTYVDWEEEDLEWVPYARFGLDAVDSRARAIETLDNLEQTSVDFYAAVRSAYRQRRNDEIANGKTQIEDLPDIQ
ncbi:MAG: VacJ family lipoprotein [Alphaproteobacteria bacterium]|nr:VacJ family lipoprotein [Alphaproteobacteria bacterium]